MPVVIKFVFERINRWWGDTSLGRLFRPLLFITWAPYLCYL